MAETGAVNTESSLSQQVDITRNLMERLTTQNQRLSDRTTVVRPVPLPPLEQAKTAETADAEALPPMANELRQINGLLEIALGEMNCTIEQIDL